MPLSTVKVPLVGQAYTLRSLTAAAQSCINLYPEVIQDPNEAAVATVTAAARGKNRALLYGIPGRHVFSNPGLSGVVRGIWTGGGRCFIAVGTQYCELNSSGAIIAGPHTISNAPAFGVANSPVQFFPNGNQLFIVSGGVPYIDDGAGPTVISQADSTGTVNAFGQGVGWVSGDQFVADGSWVGKTIIINGSPYTIADTNAALGIYAPTPTQLFTTTPVGVLSPPAYSYSVAGSQFPFAAVTGGFLDNSFWFNQPFSRAVKFSNVNNGDIWNGLDFITKDSWPDNVLSILVSGPLLYLWGDDSFEVWQANPSSSTDPFARIDGASGRFGSVSPWGPISIEGNVYFLGSGEQGQVIAYVMNGFTPTRISQHGQEAVWYANGLGPGAISYTYNEEGHTFWVINFGSQTWAFDTTTGAWHQRAAGNTFTAYPTAYHSFIPQFGAGKHLTGGPLDGVIYESRVSFYDDNGSDIYWQKALPHLYSANLRLYDYRMELEMETGLDSTGTGVITLDYSADRGHTFTGATTASTGALNAFTQRVYWVALGSYYDRVYRLTGHSQARVALIDLELEQDSGSN